MRGVGQDARIIKVASGGLNESFLWQDVADESVISRMRRRMGMYSGGEGGALIGEGGEFETLAVDGPRPLWKKRIEVESVEKVAGEGGSSFARLKGARLVGKREKEGDEMDGLRVPSLLDDEFVQALHKLEALPGPMTTGSPSLKPVGAVNCWTQFVARYQRVQDIDATSGYLQLASIMSPPHSSTASQMTDIVHQTLSKLHVLGLEPSDILHSTILLRDMSTFATINPIYGSMFTKPSPASRVTVSCGELMPPAVDIVLSIVVNTDKGRGRRQGLHVQSRSYWAPANIGPYSQAISLQLRMKEFEEDQSAWLEPRLVHVAGQIPLLPASMEIVTAEQLLLERGAETTSEKSNDFLAQSVLSLQHLWRIGRAMDVMAWIGAVAFISRCPEHEEARRASIACDAWISIHNVLDPSKKDAASHEALASNDGEEDSAEEYDVWDVKNKVVQLSSSTAEEKDPRQHLPDYFRVKYDTVDNPPVFVTQVAELPRGAAIEWCSAGIAAASQVRYSSSQQAENLEQTCSVRTSEHSETEFTFAAFDSMEGLNAFTSRESDDASRTLTAYITKPLSQVFWERFEPMLVPCFSIWGKKGEQLKQFEALIVMRKDISIENH
jgi:diphthine-ammonia ligase